MELENQYQLIEKQILNLSSESSFDGDISFSEQRSNLIQSGIRHLREDQQKRLVCEFEKLGPLDSLLKDESLTEVLINGPREIWIEQNGKLSRFNDHFLSAFSYEKILEKICTDAGALPTLERPSANGRWREFRIHAIRAPISQSPLALSLRRHPQNPWTLETLIQVSWCTPAEADLLRRILEEKRNFLVIGSTGSGKTSVLNALLASLPSDHRCGVIEDTDEIALPQGPSFKLLTREESPGGLAAIDQGELVKQCLRMRPDRLVMGEIRGGEAKDFLMALSTGHQGSFGTLHADDPNQALLRLEMLIQMGASHWNLQAIRKLIRLGLQTVIVTGKNKSGERRLRGIHRLVSLEDSGFLLEQEF